MSLNTLNEIKSALGLASESAPTVMTVSDNSDGITSLIDQAGNSITLESNITIKAGQRVIVSGGKILGAAEKPSVTIWIN